MTKQKRKYGPKPTRTNEEALEDQRKLTRWPDRRMETMGRWIRKASGDES